MRSMKLKRVGVLSVAMWHGLYSLIFAIFLGIAFTAYTYLSMGAVSPSYLLYYWVVTPLIYCPLGFISYGLVAILYNAVAGSVGGIKVEFDNDGHDAPPPPDSYFS